MMKPFLYLIFFYISISNIYSQNYQYEFKVENVSSLAEAKIVTTFLRPFFNSEDQPFLNFPYFNDEIDEYNFKSNILRSKEELDDFLFNEGYHLIMFRFKLIQNENQ